jgi:hypothetical protein
MGRLSYDMVRRCGFLAAAVAACLAAAPAAPAAVRHEQAQAGPIVASLDYEVQGYGASSNVHLSITRETSAALVADDVGASCALCRGATPVGGLSGSGARSLTIRDLDGDGEPEVIVDLYTGGAHCCSISVIYRYSSSAARYVRLAHVWGDPGYGLVPAPGGGPPLFKTADDRFADAFCAFACSLLPVQLLRLEPSGLRDVTRMDPALVRDDLGQLLKLYRRERTRKADRLAIKGILPALCADYYNLSQPRSCAALLERARRRGELAHHAGDQAPDGRRYIRSVQRFLARQGYRS